jgi:hypothetical protein
MPGSGALCAGPRGALSDMFGISAMSMFARFAFCALVALPGGLVSPVCAQTLSPPACAKDQNCRIEAPSRIAAGGGVFAIAAKAGLFVNFRREGAEIDVWDLSIGRLLRNVPAGEGAIERWAFSDDGKELKIAGRGRLETRIDLASGAAATDPADATPFAPFQSSAHGRALLMNATVEDGNVTPPEQLGAYVQQHFPQIEQLVYDRHPFYSTPESFALSDDGDYALVELRCLFSGRMPVRWRELDVFRLTDGMKVARFKLAADLGPIAHFASDGRVLLIGDVWGGVTLFPLVRADEQGNRYKGLQAVSPLWSVLAPPNTPPTALVTAFNLQAERSDTERRVAQTRASAVRMRDQARYRWPAPDPKSEIVNYYGGGAVGYSSVTYDDRVPVEVRDIVIEPGVPPLYLVVNAYRPTIWRVSGATERIQTLLVLTTSPSGASGVVGVSRDRVFFSDYSPPYVNRSVRPDEDERRALRTQDGFIIMSTLIGREPDVFPQTKGAPRVALPSGTPLLEGFTDGEKPIEGWLAPGGASKPRVYLIKVKPEEVVAERPLRPYVNLPGELGLQQLCASGALEKIGEKRYRVLKKIRIPAGIAWDVEFLLPPGVEPPDSNTIERDSVKREDTGERVKTLSPTP